MKPRNPNIQAPGKILQAVKTINQFLLRDHGSVCIVDYQQNNITLEVNGACKKCKVNKKVFKFAIVEMITKNLGKNIHVTLKGLPADV